LQSGRRTSDALGVRGQLRAHAAGGAVEQHHAAVRARRRHHVRAGVYRVDAALRRRDTRSTRRSEGARWQRRLDRALLA